MMSGTSAGKAGTIAFVDCVEGFGGGFGGRDDRDRARGQFGNRGEQADRMVRRAYQDILHR